MGSWLVIPPHGGPRFSRDSMRTEAMRHFALIPLLCTLLVPSSVAEQRVADMYGLGNHSCGAFLEAVSRQPATSVLKWEGEYWPSRSSSYIEWVLGFITAFNMTNSQAKNLSGTDSAGVAAYIQKWCGEHPIDQIHQAAWTLVRDRTGYDPTRGKNKSR